MSKRGEKLRPEVLAILRRRSGSLSAYDVLGELCEANPKVAQPTICRVLAALTECGRVYRIESLNAFIADRHQHASILSICHDYGTVEERVAPNLLKELCSIIGKSSFALMRHVIKGHGLCTSCSARQVPA